MNFEKTRRYSIRKLTVGVASVAVGMLLVGTNTAQAQETIEESGLETIANAQENPTISSEENAEANHVEEDDVSKANEQASDIMEHSNVTEEINLSPRVTAFRNASGNEQDSSTSDDSETTLVIPEGTTQINTGQYEGMSLTRIVIPEE